MAAERRCVKFVEKVRKLPPSVSLFASILYEKKKEDVSLYVRAYETTRKLLSRVVPADERFEVLRYMAADDLVSEFASKIEQSAHEGMFLQFSRRSSAVVEEEAREFAAYCGVPVKDEYNEEDFTKIATKLGPDYKLHVAGYVRTLPLDSFQ